jgi:predicted PurR-regulated permease PerM
MTLRRPLSRRLFAPRVVLGGRRSVQVEIPPRQVIRAVLLSCGVLLALLVLWLAQEVLFLLLLAILLATAIEPLVERLARGPFSRGVGILVVYTAIVLAIGVPAYAALPSLVTQSGAFLQDLPGRLDTLRSYVAAAPRPIQQAAETAIASGGQAAEVPSATSAAQLLEAGIAAAHTLFDMIMVFVLAFYWLVEREMIKEVLLRVVPGRQRRSVETVWLEVEEKLGGWVRGELLLMLAVGLMSGLGYWVMGLPNPLLLAVLAGALEIVPMIGPILSSAPAVLVALASDPVKALIVAGYALLVQQIENNVLVPRIMGHTIGISPLVVLVGILIGAALYGIAGAFLAVPVAGALQVIVAHVFHAEDPAQAEAHAEGANGSARPV